jgi:hypothetical protein
LSVLDEHSGENNERRTLPHPFHIFFHKGTTPNYLEFQLNKALGPKTKFDELRRHINSQETSGVTKMTIGWDTCRRRIAFFFEVICWYINNVELEEHLFVVKCFDTSKRIVCTSKRIVYLPNYTEVTFKVLCKWYSAMTFYMYKALREKNSISIRNWKKDHTDFNEFVLGTTTKHDIETNGLLPGKSKDVDLNGVDGDTDDNCDGIYDDDDTDSNCDGNDDNNCHGEDDDTDSNCDNNDDATGKDEIDDDDTDSKCNIIDDNNSNKCMSSIHNRDDEMRYYHMCVGFGAHLRGKCWENKSGNRWKDKNWLQIKKIMKKISTQSMHPLM